MFAAYVRMKFIVMKICTMNMKRQTKRTTSITLWFCHHEKGAHEIENSSYMKKKNTERKFVFQLKHFNVLEIHSKPFTKKLKPWLWQWHSQELLFRPTKWKAFGCSFRFVNDLLIYCLCYYGNGIFLLFHQLSDLKEIKTYTFLESFEL